MWMLKLIHCHLKSTVRTTWMPRLLWKPICHVSEYMPFYCSIKSKIIHLCTHRRIRFCCLKLYTQPCAFLLLCKTLENKSSFSHTDHFSMHIGCQTVKGRNVTHRCHSFFITFFEDLWQLARVPPANWKYVL